MFFFIVVLSAFLVLLGLYLQTLAILGKISSKNKYFIVVKYLGIFIFILGFYIKKDYILQQIISFFIVYFVGLFFLAIARKNKIL